MAEAIQQLVLDTLDKQGTIKDTRTLVLPGQTDPAASHDAQIIILGALNSLSSREVCIRSNIAVLFLASYGYLDDHVYYSRNPLSCPYSRRCFNSPQSFT